MKVLPSISIFRLVFHYTSPSITTHASSSPNSEEALSLLSIQGPPTRDTIQRACSRFLELGVGEGARGYVIVRSGALGAYIGTRGKDGAWVDAFWGENDFDKIIDVTGMYSVVGLSCHNDHSQVRETLFWEDYRRA